MPMHSNTQYTLRCKQEVPSRTEELFGVRQTVENEALRFGFDADTAFRLALAVDEACTNIITHGYADMDPGSIILDLDMQPVKVTIALTDFGRVDGGGQARLLGWRVRECRYALTRRARNACRRSAGRVYAPDGSEVTQADEAEYDKTIMRLRVGP